MRLDLALVEQGLARSRTQAQRLIKQGKVQVDGTTVYRPAYDVSKQRLSCSEQQWVSRAAWKLIGALDASGIPMPARVLDAGASTGGFTQVCLSRGAQRVYAIDVGHGQLVDQLRMDPRVVVHEGFNIRELTLAQVEHQPVDLVVADLSFISLRLLLRPLFSVLSHQGIALLMIKPQFEVGRDKLGKGGIVVDSHERQCAINRVITDAQVLGWHVLWHGDAAVSGTYGNVEHFVALEYSVIHNT